MQKRHPFIQHAFSSFSSGIPSGLGWRQKIVWLRYFSFLIVGLLLAYAQADEVAPKEYPYPFQNVYLSTILSQTEHATRPYETIQMEFLPSRRNVPLFKGRNKISMGLFLQSGKTAPLAFVISGLGGDGLSGTSLLLASDLYDLGYNVVTLPDPMSWTYILSRSETGIPGDLVNDSKEYYQFLQEVTTQLSQRYQAQVSGYALVGFSYGGLLTGFLLEEDQRQRKFNFNRALIINPALDIGYGIAKIDDLYQAGSKIPFDRLQTVMGELINLGGDIETKGLDVDLVNRTVQNLHITTDEMKWVIGNSFRESLRDIIFSSQQIHDLGILKTPASENNRNQREQEAFGFDFLGYMKQFVFPQIEKRTGVKVTANTYLKSVSFYAVTSVIQNSPHVYVMENGDDFLLNATDLVYLRRTFGSRLYLYPYGGHVGNVWFERNQTDFKSIMAF